MRIFLTGGTGYVGAAVLEAFVRAGHHVDALVRNSERASQVRARGAHPLLGDLSQPASYADAARAADGAIHAALDSAQGPSVDAVTLDTILHAPNDRERFVIYTSGLWVLGNQPSPADEDTPLDPAPMVAWRPAGEQRVLEAGGGLRTAVVRPGLVYGGARGLVSDLLKDAANGLVRIVGSGENHWPLVYDRDLGELYLRIATSASASGLYHANDEGDERVNDVVAAIAGHVTVRPSIRRMPIAEARQKLGLVADALVLNQIVRSPRARALGWSPTLHSVARNVPRLLDEWRRGRQAISASAY